VSKLNRFDAVFLTGYAIVQLLYMLNSLLTKSKDAAAGILVSLVLYFVVFIVVVGFASLRSDDPPNDNDDDREE
jgi:hypothetical protein